MNPSSSASVFGTPMVAFAPSGGGCCTPPFLRNGAESNNNAQLLGTGSAFVTSTTPPATVVQVPTTVTFGVGSIMNATGSAFGTSTTPATVVEIPVRVIPAASFGSLSTPSFCFDSTAPGLAFFRQPSSPVPEATHFLGCRCNACAAKSRPPPFAATPQYSSGEEVEGKGSKVVPYRATSEEPYYIGVRENLKVQSISAMSVYNGKSHEVLRWEDYQLGQKGTPPNPFQLSPPKFTFLPEPQPQSGEKGTPTTSPPTYFSVFQATSDTPKEPIFGKPRQPQPERWFRQNVNVIRNPFQSTSPTPSTSSIFSQTIFNTPSFSGNEVLDNPEEPIFGKVRHYFIIQGQ
ncbi:nuclear pore complex protein Nup98-Nup96-like isoform 1 [Corchorus olitorius]|uniref:Nuclear pore complex protein Nup98-Nup96-like isoform 1 n=1 Tax=Corchorus olitorius TaxID=93759 RepID=A0A1R3K5T4_9ROSI|nr:nuclear pore complex protein Nup98-Nup96-like isoform 1 [Corchorus olitorius]